MLEELALLKDVFLSNGYPEKLVLKTLEDSWPKETLKAVLKGVEQKVTAECVLVFFTLLSPAFPPPS